jgi:hypothetical protein
MEYEKVTEAIIGCAYRVYNKMGFGKRKVDVKRKIKACPPRPETGTGSGGATRSYILI